MKSILILLASITYAFATPVTLQWDQNPESNISNYKLSYGIAPGTYTASSDAGTQLEITTPDLTDGVKYYFVVQAINTDGLISPYSSEISFTVARPTYVSPKGYSVVSVSSEDKTNYPYENAIDGNLATFWRTLPSDTTLPHEIVVSLGIVKKISGFTYLQRQDASNFGSVGNYQFFVSVDGVTWTSVSNGTLPNQKTLITKTFAPSDAKFIKLKSLSDLGGAGAMTVAELDVINYVPTVPTPPKGLRKKQ